MDAIIECVPNFSEGRRLDVVDEIQEAIARTKDVFILDQHVDPDHNRSVITLAGDLDEVGPAILRGARVARDRIDRAEHRGEHPRVGAIDVVPFVPIRDLSLDDCVDWAHAAGTSIAEELEIPVYLYAAAALDPNRQRLGHIRKIGFERLSREIGRRENLQPDLAPHDCTPLRAQLL